jgi:hypothetical protein
MEGRFVAGQLVMCGGGLFSDGQLVTAGTAIKGVNGRAAEDASSPGEAKPG